MENRNAPATNTTIVLKLTYCWAFTEAGLGGLLHLLHIPLTGFVAGGFAIILISLITKYSTHVFASVMKSLALVLAVKFTLSPYSPFGAYVAVSFQALAGALLFAVFGLRNVTVIVFAVLAMLESALQKPLLAWVIMGNDFFKSATALLQKDWNINLQTLQNMLLIALSLYLLVYVLWAFVVAKWTNYLRKNIEQIRLNEVQIETAKAALLMQKKQRTKGKRTPVFVFAMAVLLVALIAFTALKVLPVAYLLRTIALLLIFFVLIPFIIKKQQQRFVSKNNTAISAAIQTIPIIRQRTLIAYEMSKPLNSLQTMKAFVTATIWLNVFYEEK